MKDLVENLKTLKKDKVIWEIVLIGLTIVNIVFTVFYLYFYNFQIGYWTIYPVCVFIMLIYLGYYENGKFKPDWTKFSIDILNEFKKIDVLEVSDYIQSVQSFLGANYIHSGTLLDIYKKLIDEQKINAKIDDLIVELID